MQQALFHKLAEFNEKKNFAKKYFKTVMKQLQG